MSIPLTGAGSSGAGIALPLASWEADSGTTPDTIISHLTSWVSVYGSYDLVQATAGNRPSLVEGYFTPGYAVDFENGNNDHMSVANPFSTTEGSIAIVFHPNTVTAKQVLVAVTDTGAANEWFEIGITAAGRIYIERNAAGTVSRVVGSSVLEAMTIHQLFIAMDGTDYYMTLDGVEENPLVVESAGSYGWFGDVASGDTFSVGAALPSGSPARPFNGQLGVVRVWNEDITH